jgi:hypothetical protein
MRPVLTPREAAVLLPLGEIVTSELPDLAAAWLVQGFDTPALRELAGTPRDDPWVIDQLWRDTREQLGLNVPPSPGDEIVVRARYEVALWRAGCRDAGAAMYRLLRLVEWLPPSSLPELVQLVHVEDEWEGRWGRSNDELMAEIEAALGALEQRLGARTG